MFTTFNFPEKEAKHGYTFNLPPVISAMQMSEIKNIVNELKYEGERYFRNRMKNYGKKSEMSEEYGRLTEKLLNEYLENGGLEDVNKDKHWLVAPFYDFLRNYNDMNRLNLIESDPFFHCKANYDAAKRGLYGAIIARVLSDSIEYVDLLKEGLSPSLKDLRADDTGWNGAVKGKSLLDSCSRYMQDYK